MGLDNLVVGCLETTTSSLGCNQQGITDLITHLINEHDMDVFVGPEWLFLPKNKLYTEEEKETIVKEIMERTKEKETLILPGTIMWQKNNRAYNSTPIITRGQKIKEYFKKVDGGTQHIASRYRFDTEFGKEDGTRFKWQNLDIGLEICADHGLLKANKEIGELDLQILIACGGFILDSCLKVKESRYGLICDGCFTETVIKKRENWQYIREEPLKKIDLLTLQQSPSKEIIGNLVLYKLQIGRQ